MQGVAMAHHAHICNEIMLPYAGIIRIRFMGMISASVSRGTPASILNYFFSIILTSYNLGQFLPVR